MAKKTGAAKPKKGIRITKGSKWKLTDVGGTHREFPVSVAEILHIGGKRYALLSVPARAKEQRKPSAKKR